MQRFINQVAAAIHRTDPRALVTVGMHSTPYMSDAPFLKQSRAVVEAFEPHPRDDYSCDALKTSWQGTTDGTFDPLGCLDFYTPHAYPDWANDTTTATFSPFYQPTSVFGLSPATPVLLGEFWDLKAQYVPMTAADSAGLYDKGYAGGLGWAWLQPMEVPFGLNGGSGYPNRQIGPHELQDKWRVWLQQTSQLLRARGVRL